MISVVLPAFNESEILANTVEEIHSFLESRNEIFEIIIVENGSVDNTELIGEQLSQDFNNVRFYSKEKPDYGNALKKGFLESKGDVIVNFDVDFFDFDFLERAISLIRDSPTVRPAIIVGSKRNTESLDQRPFLRRFATFIFSSILKIVFGLKVSDTHGVKALHRASVEPYVEKSQFGIDLFDTELVLRCEKAGLVVKEIPVSVKEARPARSSIFSRVPRTLFGLVKLKILFTKEGIVRLGDSLRVKIRS